MSVLVTGGAGFIGSHVARRLIVENDTRVVLLDDFNDSYSPIQKRANVAALSENRRVTIVEGSICDADLVGRVFDDHEISEVVHLAAHAGVRRSVVEPAPFQASNVGGTLVLLEAARRRSIRRFLFASSSTVYGLGAAAPFREDEPLGVPTSPYGATKRAGELFCLTYHGLFNVPVVCLRLFSVYGPRLRPDLAMHVFAAAIRAGRPLPLFGDGGARRGFTHVADACDGFLAALSREEAVGQCINLGHERAVPIGEVIRLLEERLGKPARIENLPARPEDMPSTCADLTKARRILGYAPNVEFSQGLDDFVRWFQSRE